jgi:hypothetical protein
MHGNQSSGTNPRYIDGIFDYCDRWCERCPLTHRCRQCGAHGGIEAAQDRSTVDSGRDVRGSHGYAELVSAWFDAERQGLLVRADAWVARLAHDDDGDALVAEAVRVKHALQIIERDRWVIQAKLSRARACSASMTAGPRNVALQHEHDGFAKVALISIDRSEAAWRVLAEWMDGSTTALALADLLAQLRRCVESEFPAARRFVRPGFDEAPM